MDGADSVDVVGTEVVGTVDGADSVDVVGAEVVGTVDGATVGGAEVGERVGAKVSWATVPAASSAKQAAGASIVHSVGIVCKVRRG